MSPAIELTQVTVVFGAQTAVDELSLTVEAGELHALLGPNGAGKTTTLRVLTGLLKPLRGDARLMGHSMSESPEAAKRVLAYLPDEPLVYGKLKPLEYLEFVAGLWGIERERAEQRARELLEWLDLWSARDKLTEAFSRGMKQKLALAGGLIHDPQVLVLDEPLTGLDAAAAWQVKDLLKARVAAGHTVLLTTHILEVAERLAQRISIIARGRIVARGTLDELRARAGRDQGTLEDVFLQLTREASSDAS